MTDKTPHDALVAYNLARGNRNRAAVWKAIQDLGLDPQGKVRSQIVKATGINRVSVQKYLDEIRNGWKPEGME